MLHRLNGMFALAIWDSVERKLFLARDRLGVKPLYYSQQPDGLYFGSEPKTLFAAGIPAEFDATTWEELLCFRYVAGTRTPFVNVERLLPGHCLTWQAGHTEIKRWWNLSERAQALLKTLVERYIAEGEPVGSRTLSKYSGLDLSAASIRNTMADLEEMGFVASPHTSSGRVPTPRGYRFFVDCLLTIRPLDRVEINQLEHQLHPPIAARIARARRFISAASFAT